MKSDCEDSATLEEKEGEVLYYNYGDVVKSRIQWFEQLKYQALSPKPATDVWSCWSVPNHSSPGESDLKNQHEHPCGSGPGLLRSPMLVSQVGRGKVKENF